MGQITNLCGPNLFNQLFQQYGDDFMKFIVAEKSKDVVREKFMEFTNHGDKVINDV